MTSEQPTGNTSSLTPLTISAAVDSGVGADWATTVRVTLTAGEEPGDKS